MAISIKKSSTENKQTVTSPSSLPEAVQTQISSNLKLDTTDYTEYKEPLKQTVTSAFLKYSVTYFCEIRFLLETPSSFSTL